VHELLDSTLLMLAGMIRPDIRLDITWRIVVNKHHGDIQVESVPGNTRFRVRLPTR
jgi:hypothetical protein